MVNVSLEVVRAAILLGITLFLWRAGRGRFETARKGWYLIIGGFGLLLFGSSLDITDNFEALNRFVVVGDTETEAFLEKFVGFLGGGVLLAVGLFRWIPTVQRLAQEIARREQAELRMRDAQAKLEARVQERTADLLKTTVALRENERRYRTLVETMVDGIITVDADGQIQSVNRAAAELFGYSPQALVVQSARMLMPEEIARALADLSNEELRESFTGSIGNRTEVIGRRQDGQHLSLEISVSEMSLEGSVHYTAHVRDITARKKFEAERADLIRERGQSQRLESLGTLAGGIAHEINTPLQYARDNTRFLADAFGDLLGVLHCHAKLLGAAEDHAVLADVVAETKAAHASADLDFLVEEMPSAIAHSNEGMERVSGIVRAIKEFSHPGVQEKGDVDLHQVITTTATVARNQWNRLCMTIRSPQMLRWKG